jgi:N6-L-threonylcarbamoyladenine synthase
MIQSKKSLTILGIETSCDETAAAVINSEKGLIAHSIFSQVTLHKKFGGVVPELASREHIKKLLPLIDELLCSNKLQLKDIDAISYTAGPGLVGALLVGSVLANGLAFSLGIPSISIHHMEAHLLAPILEGDDLKMPFIALLVSGGHTLLVEVQKKGSYKLLGQTLDDAAGEAFDKGAKLLGLDYPGGPAIAKLAQSGQPDVYTFPKPMTKTKKNLDFSFSGLKTALLYKIRQLNKEQTLTRQIKADLARAYEEAIVGSLIHKTDRAIEVTGIKSVVVAGGVGANQKLRENMKLKLAKRDVQVTYPRIEFCTDNAAMIALVGLFHYQKGIENVDYQIEVKPRWSIDNIYPINPEL